VKWLALLVVIVGCKYPDPGGSIPADDQPPDDADVDDSDTPDDTPPAVCLEPVTIDNMVQLPGKMVAGFAPAEDESFAISWLAGMNPGYTEAPLGQSYSPTNITNSVDTATLSPDGNVIYFLDENGIVNQRVRRAMRLGDNATWTTPTFSGLADGFPGRPTADDQRMFFINDTQPEEWQRMAGTWTAVRAYTAADFGNEAASTITSGNLSPDGNFLLYTITGPAEDGIHLRVRGGGGTFDGNDGAYGRGLTSGTYRDAILVANCTKLYAYNTATQHVERWDVHP